MGNIIGLLAGFRKDKRSSKIMEGIAICIYPIPYFIIALVLQIVFAFLLGWFPLQTTITMMGTTADYIASAAEGERAAGDFAAAGRHGLVDHLR